MATNKDVLDVFPGAKVVDPKDVARRSNIPAKVEQPQEQEVRTAKVDAERKSRIERALKAGARRQQGRQGRLFE